MKRFLPRDEREVLVGALSYRAAFGACAVHACPQSWTISRDLSYGDDLLTVECHQSVKLLHRLNTAAQ